MPNPEDQPGRGQERARSARFVVVWRVLLAVVLGVPAVALASMILSRPMAIDGIEPVPLGDRLDVNTAGAGPLQALPRIGPVNAQNLVEHREAHGPFTRLDDLLKVKGIGPKTLEEIRPWVRIGDTSRSRQGPATQNSP